MSTKDVVIGALLAGIFGLAALFMTLEVRGRRRAQARLRKDLALGPGIRWWPVVARPARVELVHPITATGILSNEGERARVLLVPVRAFGFSVGSGPPETIELARGATTITGLARVGNQVWVGVVPRPAEKRLLLSWDGGGFVFGTEVELVHRERGPGPGLAVAPTSDEERAPFLALHDAHGLVRQPEP